MNRLLIVDDMPIIVNGMANLLASHSELELEILRAYTVFEALAIMKRHQVDIVITDIKMPVKTGIDLLKEIKVHWPLCKVIFLTCYDDFSYAKEVVSLGGFDYILKTEDDERIITAIHNALRASQSDLDKEYLLKRSRELYNQAKPILQKEYFVELLEGRRPVIDICADRFKQLDIKLDANQPVYLLLMRLDDSARTESPTEWMRRFFSIQTILEDCMGDKVNIFSVTNNRHDNVWLVQPTSPSAQAGRGWEGIFQFIYDTLEEVQNRCISLLQSRMSFMVSAKPIRWASLPEAFSRLDLLFKTGISLNGGILTTDADVVRHVTRQNVVWSSYGTQRKELRLNRYSNLSEYLNNGQEDAFFTLLRELTDEVAEHEESVGAKLEAYHYLSLIFMSYMNRWNLLGEANMQMGVGYLTSFDCRDAWRPYAEYFSKLAGVLFKIRAESQHEQTNHVVNDVQEFIGNNLHFDLSLTQLSSHVHLNPSYLSRLYKQITGISLTDYITEQRIRKARELLSRKDMKIQEISQALGYNSGTAFTRFFKKIVGVTPQEFRDDNF